MKLRVAGILIKNDHILLARHRRNGRSHWTLPGGGIEEHETLTDALQREWLEETGITLSGEPELRFLLDVITPRGGRGRDRHICNLIFEVHRVTGQAPVAPSLTPGEHLDEMEWIPLAQLNELLFVPPIQAEIKLIAQRDNTQGNNTAVPTYLGNRWLDLEILQGE